MRDAHVKEIDTAFSAGLSFDAAPDRYREFAASAVRAHGALEALDYNRMDFRTRKSALVLAVAARLDIHGVLFLSSHGRPRMRIFDRDGTEATMCGNGIRCAARYFRDHGCVTASHFTIETLDGPKPVFLENRWVTVDMGRARGYRRLAEDRHFAFTGIPHLVILADGVSVDAARAEGRRLRYDRALGAALGHPDGVT